MMTQLSNNERFSKNIKIKTHIFNVYAAEWLHIVIDSIVCPSHFYPEHNFKTMQGKGR